MKEITNYSNYKEYLKDIYQEKSHVQHGFSFSVWAKSINISSPSTLSMVVNGKRHPSKALTQKLSDYLELDENEKSFFEGLIQLQKSKVNSPHLTIHLNENKKEIQSDKFYDISTFIIRELLNNKVIGDPVTYISEHLSSKLPKDEIESKLLFLIGKGLLKVEGNLYTSCGNIFEQISSSKEGIIGFHESAMKSSTAALEKVNFNQRAFHSSILSVKKEKLLKAKEMIQDFQHQMTEFLEDETQAGDQVMILNLNLYPVTK